MSHFCDQSCLSFDDTQSSASRIYGGVEAKLSKCGKCGYRMFEPLPSPEMLDKFYTQEYWNETSVEDEAAKTYGEFEAGEGEGADYIRRLMALFEANGIDPKNLRIHDVGCGFGWAVHALNKAGGRATGTDLSERSVKAGHALGNAALTCAKAEDYLAQCGEKMDVIFMSHSLEHMIDPAQTVAGLAPFLADDGLFVILVPNGLYVRAMVDSFASWGWCSYPNHLHYFTPKSFTCLLRKTGLRLIDVMSGSYEPWPGELARTLFDRGKEQIPDWGSVHMMLAANIMGTELQIVAAKTNSSRKPTERSIKTLAALGDEKNALSDNGGKDRRDIARLKAEILALQQEQRQILGSSSWRITAPLRLLNLLIRKIRR